MIDDINRADWGRIDHERHDKIDRYVGWACIAALAFLVCGVHAGWF